MKQSPAGNTSAIAVTLSLAVILLTGSHPALAQAPSTFRHPGVLVNRAQLDFVKAQVSASVDPWLSGFNKAATSTYASLTYTPHPWQTVECGPSSVPNLGCSDERNDALAAYTQALLWYLTGNQTYAQNSIMIMNAWSSTLTGGHINSNAPLQAGWTGSVWPEAAEIIRYSNAGWFSSDIASFQNMLNTQYLPNLIDGAPCKNGNWEAIITEAMMNISVFNEDSSLFNRAVSFWRGRVPAYMYLPSDGPTPVPPPRCSTSVFSYWNQTSFVDGLAQETARDFGHTFWGLAASVNAAETAFQQGVNLYAENAQRIVDAFEFHNFINNGGSAPSGINVGPTGGNGATMEIAYNHFHNRLGFNMPQTAQQIAVRRPTGANYFLAWETLTHAQVGSIGFQSDFAFSATPGSQTVTPGGTVSYIASASPIGGFTGTVNLGVSGLPSGATATFSPPSISGGSGSSTLSVSTSTSTPTGTYSLTIAGTSSSPSLSHSTTVTLIVNATALPPGWTDSDVGTPAMAGSATFSGGTFTVSGGGADIWSTADSFHYAYQSLSGDLTITARVSSQQDTDPWAKAGVMIRETTAANSAYVFVMVTPSNGVNMQYRPSPGASAVQLARISGVVAPTWVRLLRSGNTFTGFSSADGVNWTQLGSIGVTMASNPREGLAVTAHDNTLLSASTFDNVTVAGPQPDFALSAAPSSQVVTQGGSTTYSASVSPTAGFAGTVTLSVSGLPSGVTGIFNPVSLSGGSGSSTLTVSTASTTPTGTYSLTIAGVSGSLSHSTTVTLTVNSACVTGSAGDGWHNLPLAAAQTGTFTAQYDATPSASPINAVVALSQGSQTAYTGFATLARFNPSGNIDARDGGAYAGASAIPYSGGVSYHFRLVINVTTHTYSVYVTPAGGAEQLVGTNLAFRSEQSGVTALDWWGLDLNVSNPGSLTTCNFSVGL